MSNLSEASLKKIAVLCKSSQSLPAHAEVVRQGQGTDHIHVVLEGWACRYRLLTDGRRQVPALLVPGDVCDLDALMLQRIHFGVATVTPCTISSIPRAQFQELLDQSPEIRDVIWWLISVENAISVEWTVGLGRRSTEEHFAHLVCELLVRLTAVQIAQDNSYQFPLTQQELGDVLGVSTVHVNRTIQDLRARGIISFGQRQITILDWDKLRQIGDFDTDYLHVEGMTLASAGAADTPGMDGAAKT